jgi:two-component system sensor histidine kinase KdpD
VLLANRETFWRLPTAALIPIAITWLCFQLLHVNSTTVALAYLLAILVVAARWGLAVSAPMSLLSMVFFNYYFLPPIRTFTISDPQNWVALFAFLGAAIVASQLSDSASRKAREAIHRQQEMERLYELSRALILGPGDHPVGAQVAEQVARIFACQAVAFYDRSNGQVLRAGPGDMPLADIKLQDAALQGTEFQDPATQTTVLPVTLGGHALGSLAATGGSISETGLHAIANLTAIAIEKDHAQAAANRAEAERHNEQLKSTLLDAVAHEFKTPLTSIKAATSAMLDGHSHNESTRELLTVIDEEADRLSELVTEAIQMARIEAGKLRVEKRPLNLPELIEGTIEQSRSLLAERKVEWTGRTALPAVEADPELIHLVLRQILNNALKYSPAGSPLTIEASPGEDGVRVTISDRGCGIPQYEQEHIFDKFYRAGNVRSKVPGTGMGLSIARQIVLAHGGRIWVESRAGGGSSFSFSLPLAEVTVTNVTVTK